ncbi:hypothetical protein F2Q69_00037721 [Brassica cretica]|uniref:Uncharacterized protein n=1 Tax=Brassica cretica TaxID=69181 RepID=A0A8S9STF4_BRACR|nr:hypothetical protein F2Q69_00037721 [Brassica cretica]
MRDIWPHGHCHPSCLLDWPVLVPAPVSIPGIPSRSLRGFLVLLGSVWSDRLRILLLLRLGTAGDLFVEVSVGEDASLESRDSSGDTAFEDSHLFLIEAGYVASQGFRSMMEDFVEAVGGFLQVPTVGKLFQELIAANCEGGYGPGGLVDIPLQSKSGQSGAKTFAHGSFV